MQNEELSESCSTCSESQSDRASSCYSDSTSLTDSDVEWLSQGVDDKGHLFYFKLVHDKDNIEKNDVVDSVSDLSPKIDNNQGFRASYTKLAAWVFDNKKFGLKKSSLKKKSLKKPSIKEEKEVIPPPVISVTDCYDNQLVQLILDKDESDSRVSSDNNAGDDFAGDDFAGDVGDDSGDDFILMYLTPPGENNSNERDCLVFSHPTQAQTSEQSGRLTVSQTSEQSGRLTVSQTSDQLGSLVVLKLKGMFITMSQVVCKITNQHPIISTISVTKDNQEKNFYVGFVQEFSSVLAISLSVKKFSSFQVKIIVDTVARMICFLYNSLDAAFKNERNLNDLKKMCRIIKHLFNKREIIRDHNNDSSLFINSIPRLLINDELLSKSLLLLN